MGEKKEKPSNLETFDEYLEALKILANQFMDFSPEGPTWNTETCCLQALSNVFITPKEVIVTADLPNIDSKTIKIETMGEKRIEIIAKMKKKVRFMDLGIYHRKGEFSFLRCQNRIDVVFDIKKMKFSFKEGILEVRIPRKNKS